MKSKTPKSLGLFAISKLDIVVRGAENKEPVRQLDIDYSDKSSNDEMLLCEEWIVMQEQRQHEHYLEFYRKDFTNASELERLIALTEYERAKKGFETGDWGANENAEVDLTTSNKVSAPIEVGVWEAEIKELETFFSSVKLPDHTIQLDMVSRIPRKPNFEGIRMAKPRQEEKGKKNAKQKKKTFEPYLVRLQRLKVNLENIDPMPSFINTHMKIAKANQGNKIFEPYLDRLKKLKSILEKEDLAPPDDCKVRSMRNKLL